MKVRKVNRYYCDFCTKANCSGAAMKRHEERCTLNPDRVCGMCKLMEQEQAPMQALLDCLPTPQEKEFGGIYIGPGNVVEEAMSRLRQVSGNCPACILAALRQKGVPVPLMPFEFKKECTAVWTDFNDRNLE